ncbi:MAG: ABC transporter ATP-binding protein [Clostridia bacterium]|nr:ABC transporter ATP-binding protein [Clostridia bacterium]
MIKLLKDLRPMLKFLIVAIILLATGALAELYLPGLMADIINDGIYLDYEEAYQHLEMENPFGDIDIEFESQVYHEGYIPVFEMKDGFTTSDIKIAWNEKFTGGNTIGFEFNSMQVKDSEQLFEEVLIPFMNALEKVSFKNTGHTKWSQYSPTEQLEVKEAISFLIDYDSLIAVDLNGNGVNIETFLGMFKDDDEDSSVWDDENAKKLLTACVMCMKHSKYGNLLPIPVLCDKDGKKMTDAYGEYIRVPVDSYGEPLDKSQLTYIYNKDAERNEPFLDYEIILCNDVGGYAYKYVNEQKWIKNRLGMTDYEIDMAVKSYIAVDNDQSFLGKIRRGWNEFTEIISLSKTGSTTADLSIKVEKTSDEWKIADGITIQTSSLMFILKKGLFMLLITLLSSSFTIIAMKFSSKIAAYFSKVLRTKVFHKVEGFSLAEFDKFGTASLVTRSTNDINQIQNVFLVVLRTTLSTPITIIGGFIFSFRTNVYMTSVLLYVMPILFIAAGVAAIVVQPYFKIIQKKVDQLTLIMREGITGIRVVRAFNKQDQENRRFNVVNKETSQAAMTLQYYCAALVPLINICLNCCSVGIYWRASQEVAGIAGDSLNDVASMLEVSQYITQIAMAMVFIASAVVIFPRATASAERIVKVLETEVKVKDAEGCKDEGDNSCTIEFNNVDFKYSEEAEKNILENITFKCEKGKTTAIVGGTGSGKSTIINLIPRFYDITSGSLKVNGQEVRTYPQNELRKKIGFVPQRSMLFSGTIADNLRYGNADATDEDMWDALRIAQSDTFVREKEGQLLYPVDQGGQNFSGGQKQRLSIARAVARRPEIYIFDDSFSALDFKTDKKLRTALKETTQESIVIIVAQRIGTIMDADEIIVMDDGRMVGKGKHKDLLQNCQLYRDIALSQMSPEELGL